MTSTTQNVKLGVCSPLYDGTNMGLTKGGVEVEVSTETHEIMVDQFGSTPIGEMITGRVVTATVPLAETTLENLVKVMPGAQLITDGIKATGTITLTVGAPANGDKIVINGNTFTFRTVPSAVNDVLIGATHTASATNLASAINVSDSGYAASVAAAVVTVTSRATGTAWNGTIVATFATPANVSTTPLAGGITATSARVVVSTGVNTNLMSLAKKLILRPRGTFGDDDFIIYAAACPGALSFAYSIDNERIYQAAFKGYAQADGTLFAIGRDA